MMNGSKAGSVAPAAVDETRVATYWLHVEDDGSETRYERDPFPRPTLRVELLLTSAGYVEQTKTASPRGLGPGPTFTRYGIKPRGHGWTLHADEDSDKHTTWRRPAGREALRDHA